jgi:hypothetical protein
MSAVADGYIPPSTALNPPPCYHAAVLNDRCDCGKPAPWRFDVPEVPAHVTALRSEQPHGRMWFRTAAPMDGEGLAGSWWIPVRRRKHDPGPVMHITDLATYAPLVECEDPRGTG